jgi:hypothetical protein
MATLPGDVTVTVTPAAPRGAFGDPSGAAAEPWQIDGCQFAPAESAESHDRADTVVTTATLYVPDGHTIPTTAKVTVGDFVGEVDGDPEPWAGAGTVVKLRRVTG